jgi:hypothetical protein
MKLATTIAATLAAAFALPAAAHHGLGRFDPTRSIELEGTLTGLDFVNPHSYVHFVTVGADGATLSMSSEMRAATRTKPTFTSARRPPRTPRTAAASGGYRTAPASSSSCWCRRVSVRASGRRCARAGSSPTVSER